MSTGLQGMTAMFDEDVTAHCGPLGKHNADRCEHERRRWAGWWMAGSLTAVLYE